VKEISTKTTLPVLPIKNDVLFPDIVSTADKINAGTEHMEKGIV